MGKINLVRVLLGGLVAGIVNNVITFQVDGAIFHYFTWPALFAHKVSIGMDDFTGLCLLGLAGGITAIWVYAAIRPRFGAGLKTAIIAGLTTWVIGTLLPRVFIISFFDNIPKKGWIYATIGSVFEVTIATVAGAYFYKE